MGGFSLIHWIILGIFLLLLFGGNRFSAMMGDVAKGLKSFKQGMADEDDEQAPRYDEQRRNEPPRQIPRDELPASRSTSRRAGAIRRAAAAARRRSPLSSPEGAGMFGVDSTEF